MASQKTSAGDPQPPVMESTHVTQDLTSAVAVNTESGQPAVKQGTYTVVFEDGYVCTIMEEEDCPYDCQDEYDDDFVPYANKGDEMRDEDDYERYMWGMIRDFGLGCDIPYDASEARYEDRE